MERTGLTLLALLLATALGGLAASPYVHAWERAAGYPYGKACNSILTFYVDTCPR